MIPADELAAIRAEVNLLLNETVVISRLTQSDNGAGGFTESWAAAGTVTGRIGPLDKQGREGLVGDRLAGRFGYTVTLPATTDVRAADRLTVGTRVFEVVQPIARSNETARVVICAEVV